MSRVELLKEVNEVILDTGDEDIYDIWFTYGIPDECDNDMYKEIANDDDSYNYIMRLFVKLFIRSIEK